MIGEGNDWLYLIIADIAAAQNFFVENLYAEIDSQRGSHSLACLLPQEAAFVYPAETSEFIAILGSENRMTRKKMETMIFLSLYFSHSLLLQLPWCA